METIYYLIKPASGLCNMRCRYCFYADEMNKREVPDFGIMSAETAEKLIRQAFSVPAASYTFAFQGGEPTLAGIGYFRHFIEYVNQTNEKKAPVNYSLQTNGYALSREWVELFAKEKFLVGVSLDGTQWLHDQYRVDAKGAGTWSRVLSSVKMLQEAKVDFNILTVVTAQTAKHPEQVYRALGQMGLTFQQYIACLDPLGEERGHYKYSLTPKLYGHFLKTVFDLWFQDIIEGRQAYNRTFENWIGMLLGQAPESCGMAGHCSGQMVAEADGRIYPCDFYVLDDYCIGTVDDTREQIEKNREALGFIQASRVIDPECKVCRWYPLCRGGCRRDRDFTGKPDGGLSRNYFCRAYKEFFEYACPRMEYLAECLSRRMP